MYGYMCIFIYRVTTSTRERGLSHISKNSMHFGDEPETSFLNMRVRSWTARKRTVSFSKQLCTFYKRALFLTQFTHGLCLWHV